MTEPTARGGGEVVEPSAGEVAHARRTAEAKATVPHVYFEAEAEAAPVATEDLVAATALSLRDFPRLNGSYRDARFQLHSRINVGVAVATDAGLVYPTIHDADQKDAQSIAAEIAELGARVSSGAITQPELSGATFSVADLAPLGISRAQLVVNRGQAAILAAGSRGPSTTTLSLACDSRMIQAPEAAGFLARVGELVVA
ncbi:MAG: 2-oxo acid dehydrogenase subunit E2 [Solirubrobacterales bacterium]